MKILTIDNNQFIVDSRLDERKATEMLVLASFNHSIFIENIIAMGYHIEPVSGAEIKLEKNQIIADMNWKVIFPFGSYAAYWNKELFYSPMAKDGSLDSNDIQPLIFLYKGKEIEYLEEINKKFNVNFTINDFQNNIEDIIVPDLQPKILINLETNEELRKDEVEALLPDAINFFREKSTNLLVVCEFFTMDSSCLIDFYRPDTKFNMSTFTVLEKEKLIQSKWIEIDDETGEYEEDVVDCMLDICRESQIKQVKYFYYTENKEGVTIEKTIKTSRQLGDELEDLLSGEIDCYCFFNEGIKIDSEDFNKLKEIGVSAYIGICSRINDELALKEFNVTEKELETTKYLISKYNK